jgi:hypothetical protein
LELITALNITMKMVQRELIKWHLAIMVCWVVLPLFATANSVEETYSKLVSVNKNWEGLSKEITCTQNPTSEVGLIQLHLLNVIGYLEAQPLSELDSIQQQNRLTNIAILRSYCLAGNYPINNITSYRTPIFIDSKGVHCAVGYLLKENGLGNVAHNIAKNQLLAYVDEIKHVQLNTWQKTCGLSMFELALIQPTYGPPIPVCAAESPIEWQTVTVNSKITHLFNGINATIYGISQLDESGLQQEIVSFNETTLEWKSFGPQLSGQFLDLVFCKDVLYVSVFLPFEKYPHQLLRLIDGKWDKVAHFNGSVSAMEVLHNKLYVKGNFNKVDDRIQSNFVVIDGSTIKTFAAIGLTHTSFDHMKASETALFLTSGGAVYKFKNDTIQFLTSIQYYNYMPSISLDALADTLYVSSMGIQGYNKYYDKAEHPVYMNNTLFGHDYPYRSVFFTQCKKVNGNMLVAGDFKTSTLMPQVNDERVLTPCPEAKSAHWYGEGLLYEYEKKYYPILDKGIVLDFVQLNDRIYILKNDGSICFSDLKDIDKEIVSLIKKAGM